MALISGGVSLAAATISLLNARSVARLNNELEERRRARTKEEQAGELRARYRDPLLSAAFDLQSRLFNIVAKEFLVHYCGDEDETFAQLRGREHAVRPGRVPRLGWRSSGVRFASSISGDKLANRQWVTAIERVRDMLARDDIDPVLRVFRGDQRAIGES